MASLAMRPTAVEFVDTVLVADNSQLVLEDFTIPDGSAWAGRAISSLAPEGGDIVILAVKRAGTMLFRPEPQTPLAARDEIVVAGSLEGIQGLHGRLRGT
jgi:Trk K+ transport system NAD-binding subunit